MLAGLRLPDHYRDHPLSGEWTGYREFHAAPDWLVIYRIVRNYLVLARTGTHADLFKK
jgi:addiction module toxin, RelE/StbE family